MITSEEQAWARLHQTNGIGEKSLWSIAEYLARTKRRASWLCSHPEELLEALGPRAVPPLIPAKPENDHGFKILYPRHRNFPRRLARVRNDLQDVKNRPGIPAILYIRGNLELLKRPSVAIIGAREAGQSAIEVTQDLARQLTQSDINVISGHAKGIDSAAHLSALQESGTTTIVLSEGINHFRPKMHLKPFITEENTLVISQFKPGDRWTAYFAMTRNVLVCALSDAVVVIVSGPERDAKGRVSGTFDAAKTAMKLGIPTLVVSPAYFDDKPEGNEQLIRMGCQEWNPQDRGQSILCTNKRRPKSKDRAVKLRDSMEDQYKFSFDGQRPRMQD